MGELLQSAAISRLAFKRRNDVTHFVQTHFKSLPPNVSIFKWSTWPPKCKLLSLAHITSVASARNNLILINPVLSRISTEPRAFINASGNHLAPVVWDIKKEQKEEWHFIGCFFLSLPDHSRRNPITAVFGDRWDYSVSKRGKNNQSLSDFQL